MNACQNQGCGEDAESYYVWSITQFSTHQVIIEFTEAQQNSELLTVPIAGAIIAIAVIAIAALFIIRRTKKQMLKPQTKHKRMISRQVNRDSLFFL